MEIKVGKFYVDANGDKFGPMRESDVQGCFTDGFTTWRADGSQFVTMRSWHIELTDEAAHPR